MSSVSSLAKPESFSQPVSRAVDICQALWEIETRYGLLYRRVHGCYPWALRRWRVYYKLEGELGAFDTSEQRRLPDDDPQVYQEPPRSIDHPRRHLFRLATVHHRPDWLVIPKTKLPNHDGGWRCPYTAPTIESALANNARVFILRNGVAWQREQAAVRGARFGQLSTDWVKRWIDVRHASRRVRHRSRIKSEELDFWTTMGQELQALLGVKLNLVDEMRTAIRKFKAEYPVYRWIVRLLRPRRVLLFCHYGNKGAIIHAARRQDIPTIEIQHGTLGPYHLGYSFPAWKPHHDPIPYFPDEFWSWGKFWTENTALPLPDDRIVVKGFSHFQQHLERSLRERPSRDARTILVLSQGVVAEPLIGLISQLANHHPNYRFVFKCHPAENAEPPRKALEGYRNVKVVAGGDLYAMMDSSQYVMGVFSTALYEAIALGCKPILLNLPGIEHARNLVDSYAVPVFGGGGDFLACLQHAQHCHVPRGDLF